MATIYCTATNTGKGFITHDEQENANPLNAKGFPGNVWGVEDNATGQAWQTKVSGVVKTKDEFIDFLKIWVLMRQNLLFTVIFF